MLVAGGSAMVAALVASVFLVFGRSTAVMQLWLLGDYGASHDFAQSIQPGRATNVEKCSGVSDSLCVANWGSPPPSAVEFQRLADGGTYRTLDKTVTFLEAAWGPRNRLGYELIAGRWPAADGEAVVSDGLEGTSHITAWGERINLRVVGEVRRKGWRDTNEVLVFPGSIGHDPRGGLELTGMQALVTAYFDGSPDVVLPKLSRSLGQPVPQHPFVRTREGMGWTAFDNKTALLMVLPGALLALAGGLASGFMLAGWRRSTEAALFRQGVPRHLTRGWIRRAQMRGLLVAVPPAVVLGFGAGWLLKPLVQYLMRQPVSSPSWNNWLLLLPVLIFVGSLLGVAAGRERAPSAPSPTPAPATRRSSWRRGCAFVLAVSALWAQPLLGNTPDLARWVSGGLLAVGLSLSVPDLIALLARVPLKPVLVRLGQRQLASVAHRLGSRLVVIAAALSVITVILTSLGASFREFNRMMSEQTAVPPNTVMINNLPEVRPRLDEWQEKSGTRAVGIWFGPNDQRGLPILAVQTIEDASLVLARPLTAAERQALSSGHLLAGADAPPEVEVQHGSRPSIPTQHLSTNAPLLRQRAGLMLLSTMQALAPVDKDPVEYLMGGMAGDVTKVVEAATSLGIGQSYYTAPYVPPPYKGTPEQRLQPWLLGLLSALVMGSVLSALAVQSRPAQAAMLTLGMPLSAARTLLWAQCGVITVVLAAATVLPSILGLMLVRFQGQNPLLPWSFLVRSFLSVVGGSVVGALLGSLRVSVRERMSNG